MHNSKSDNNTAQVNVSEAEGQDAGLGIGARIAPAVALLLMADAVSADSEDDGLSDEDTTTVPEPSVLSMLAVGAVVVGAAKYIQNKRRK